MQDIINDVRGLPEGTAARLIESASGYDRNGFAIFAAELGWEDWMLDLCPGAQLSEDEIYEPNHREEERINTVLRVLFDLAHENALTSVSKLDADASVSVRYGYGRSFDGTAGDIIAEHAAELATMRVYAEYVGRYDVNVVKAYAFEIR